MSPRSDINDLLRDGGPSAVQAAFAGARAVVRATATPTPSARDDKAVELLKTVTMVEGTGGLMFRRCVVPMRRADFRAAAEEAERLATATHQCMPYKFRGWDRIGTSQHACGMGWSSSSDGMQDIVTRRKPCNVPGSPCGAARARGNVIKALERLDAVSPKPYRMMLLVKSLAPRREPGEPVLHAAYLASAGKAFDELRSANVIAGGFAYERTEAPLASWGACVIAICVTVDPDAIEAALPSWRARVLGPLDEGRRRGIAGWLASHGGMRFAPELNVADRAACLLDEYATDGRGTLVFGILHGNALNQLERGVASADTTLSGASDATFQPAPTCPCGAPLYYQGPCDVAALAADGWSPGRRFRIANADGSLGTRFLTKKQATAAIADRDALIAHARAASLVVPPPPTNLCEFGVAHYPFTEM